MTTLSHANLVELIAVAGQRLVSIYLPTAPSGHEMPQNRVRFKNLLKQAENSLIADGASRDNAQTLLAPSRELLEKPTFWETLSAGLAVLISASEMHVWQLPMACEVRCVVGKRYYITPLVQWLIDDAPYSVLAISQNHVRLFHGSRTRLSAVPLRGLPTSKEQALHYDKREGFFEYHTGHASLPGKEGLVFTGQGGEGDVKKEELASFFKIVDAAVSKHLNGRTEPLIFAGVDYLFPIYRQHNHYPHLMQQHIAGNPDLLSNDELRNRAWALVETSLRERQTLELEKYWNMVHQGRVCNRLEDIIPAAQAGAVETLFINPTIHLPGSFDVENNSINIHVEEQSDSEDLINLAISLVLEHGGHVQIIATGDIPGGGLMAAILRYPNPLNLDLQFASKASI
jgi:hypothetical protein